MREKEADKHYIILLYVTLICPASIMLFLYGFFPLVNYNNTIATEHDIPKYIENVRVKTNILYEPMVKRLIIMVIDALRWDFITGSIGKVAMPVTSSLIANSSACLLQTKVHPPTVTMPKIKAITTGMVPNFIDVMSNFGSKPINGDSVLLQANKFGYKTIFYGDDTWIKLFPSIFHRYSGVSSFVVTDFTEVDNNVTTHLNEELYGKDDWSIMILHYLGVDHIGHVHGPFSPLIKIKLNEMDNIIAQIQSVVQKRNQNNDATLFVICGDHGMRDSGGHGGSTMSETTVPFIAIGGDCLQNHNHFGEISQVDIASTLSVILGVPIPFSNIGTVFLDTLYDLPVSKKLFILHYNARQVFTHFQKLVDYEFEYAYKKYLDAIKLHSLWLNTKDHSDDIANDIVLSYRIALEKMKEIIINKTIKYDFLMITVSIIFMCHIMCILVGKVSSRTPTTKNVIRYIVLNILNLTLVYYFWRCEDISLFESTKLATIILVLCVMTVLTINSYLLAGIRGFNILKFERSESGVGKWLLPFALLAHAISLGGSSFVEEEHQTWYFYWAAVLTLLLYNSTTRCFSHLRYYRNYKQYLYVQICIKLVLLLVAHRIFRKLNTTGDKYADLPNIAGYLMGQESKLGVTMLVIIGISLLMWINFVHEDKKYKQQSLILNFIASICIYLRHMNNNTVAKIPLYPQSEGIYEVQIFWLLVLVSLATFIYRLIRTIKYDRTMLFRTALYFILHIWIMITAMLHKPYNVILLPFQVIFSVVISSIVKLYVAQEINIFLYILIGNVFYFYQGNSNSLATVDVTVGYIGVQTYMPFINGSLLVINTYSAPVLSYLLFIYYTILEHPYHTHETVVRISKAYVTWRLLPITIYMVIITIQRHHIFVWSVFSPKLLYEALYSSVVCFIILVILFFVTIERVLSNSER